MQASSAENSATSPISLLAPLSDLYSPRISDGGNIMLAAVGISAFNLTKGPTMAFNIVSAVARYLTPEVVGKIATASGLNGSVAQSAVNAAVPAILSVLTSVADKPGGARKLADAVAEQPADMLTSLASKLTGPAQMAS